MNLRVREKVLGYKLMKGEMLGVAAERLHKQKIVQTNLGVGIT